VAGDPVLPWVLLVTSRTNDQVLKYGVELDEPTSGTLWDALVEAMKKPMAGQPNRPTTLQFRPDGPAVPLVPHLEALGVRCEETAELDQLNFVFEALRAQIAGTGPPGLLEMPGVEPKQVAGFYHAAASFYRRAPWRSLSYEEAVKIECGQLDSGPWYAVIMGQSGLTTGLALYDDIEVLRRLWAREASDEENARETVALTVTFEIEDEVPDADLEACRHHCWEVAGSEAYPVVFRKERGMSIRPPLSWELRLMEACLRALPKFLSHHSPGDLTAESMTVPTADGKLDLVLTRVEG
jgi:hypothetical protein